MATDRKISELTSLGAAPVAADYLDIVDISEPLDADKNKRVLTSDLFLYLGAGNFAGDVVMDSGATLDMQVGTIYVNEAVDLTATSTELNQLDGVTVGGTSSGDIVDLDTAQTLASKTLTTPTVADLTNMNHNHQNAAGGGLIGELTITIPVFDAVSSVTTGEKSIIVISSEFSSMNLTGVICGVWDKGVTGTTDIGIYRSRGGAEVAMLSTEVTIGDEWYASDEVIDTGNDDVATGDLININISGIHSGTAPKGLTVTLQFGI